jgi:hypothetical protein
MIFDPYISITESLIKAWLTRKKQIRLALLFAIASVLIAIVAQALASFSLLRRPVADAAGAALGVVAGLIAMAIVAYQNVQERQAREDKIEIVEERVREHPERPQLAWDLARTKLESYLDRNLAQVRSIYWLTLLVMACGFGFILYGVYQAFHAPEKLPVSIVASASGVLVSFIGGSLLLIYRSILAQSKDYVTVLERINAVGMAVQVIASIPESGQDLKNKTTAELAKQLLTLYAKRRDLKDTE